MSDDDDHRAQEAIHEALATVLMKADLLPDGALLTGWLLAFEYHDDD